MSEKMTLEQVRHWHQRQARSCGIHDHLQSEGELHDQMANAIDAHLNAAKGEAVATDKLTLTAPEQIYLQISDEPEHRNEEFRDYGVTWCSESVLAVEVKYIRADLTHPASKDVVRTRLDNVSVSEVEALKAQINKMRIKLDVTGSMLTEIYSLLYPPIQMDIEGRHLRFTSQQANDWMQCLSDRIRAIPIKLDAMAAREGK